MSHDFIKHMAEHNTRWYGIIFSAYIGGILLLINSYMADLLMSHVEIGATLAMCAALLLGLPLIYHALRDLFDGSMEMNELAALSFTASFCTEQYRAAAFIALFMIAAQMIEWRSQFGARKNLEALINLTPENAFVVIGGSIVQQDASTLKKGDLVQVLPGDRIPGDGKILEGMSTINEAALTGEAVPVEKGVGADVFSGTMNLTGRILMRISADQEQSTLAKIKDMITQAESSRTPSMRVVDAYAVWYTPLILILAAILLFFTHDINRAIAMLIIACPCTVLLSGPAALVSALSAAARLGVIVRDVSALETASKIDTVVFDKTGTLTHGSFAVTAVSTFNGYAADDLLRLAGSVARFSNHPAAAAVAAECAARGFSFLAVDAFYERAGYGVSGTVAGKPVALGRREWIAECCGQPSAATPYSGQGTQVNIAIETSHAGVLELQDTLKADAPAVVEQLQNGPIRHVIMMTGDRGEAAGWVADQLNCEYEAEVLPHRKMERVEQLKRQGHKVAVVGDGVNDAPALSAGDVGIAMGVRGSDVAVNSASVVLMNDKLNRLPFIFGLSRRAVFTIRQNLAFSTIFILVMLVLSAGGAVTPVLAAVLHAASTVAVLFNAARLLRMGEEIQ